MKGIIMLKRIITTLALFFAIIPFTSACGSDDAGPTAAEGNWADEPTFTAIIHNQTIEITLVGDESKSLYWIGTFPAKTLNPGDEITSEGDTEKLSRSLLGSTDDSKTFTYEDGTLNFEFSIMGSTRTVHLDES